MTPRSILRVASAFALAAATAHTGEIRGRVVVDDEALAGVEVSVLPFEDADRHARREARGEEAPSPLATTVTARDGAFALAFEAGDAEVPVQLAFSGGQTPPVVLQRLLDAAGEDVGDVRLGAATPLAGRVVDERGGPVVGATVRLWAGQGGGFGDDRTPVDALPQTTTTGPDGAFRFDGASETGNRFRVEAAGLVTVERTGVRGGALARPVTLGLGQVIRGTVTFPDRQTPAPDALVRYEGRSTTRWSEVRPDGSFLLEGVPAVGGGEVVADAGERGRGVTPVAAVARDPILVVLAPTAVLTGVVVDAHGGRPLPAIRLVAQADGATVLARSGRDGRYVIRGLSPRSYRLEVEDPRFVPWSRQVYVAAGRQERQDVPLVRGATLSGRVVDERGVPIEGATIQVTRGGEGRMRDFVRRMRDRGGAVRSRRDGTFEARRLTPGPGQRLDVGHDEHENRSLGGIDLAPGATTSGIRVVLRRGLELAGVVKDGDDRPLMGAEVELQQAVTFRGRRGRMAFTMPDALPRRKTGADGRFRFGGLKAGDYTLTARHPGHARATLDPVKIVEDGTEPVELVLGPGASISGFVKDSAGNGASGWSVAASPAGQRGGGLRPAGLDVQEPSGPDGAFLIEGLTEGESYDLQALGPSGIGPRKTDVTAPADDVELTVKGLGAIAGRVSESEGGQPVADFGVMYRPEARGGMRFMFRAGPGGGGPWQPRTFHAEDGQFVLEDVPAGRWTVEVSAEGFQPGTAAGVVVDEGGRAEGVEIALSKGGTIQGRVVESQSGRPLPDATVRGELSGGGGRGGPMPLLQGGAANEAMTDAEGRYEITGLAPGTWSVIASHPDWSESTVTVELEDAPTTADLRLGRGGSVGGVVLAAGRPVAGAEVGLAEAGDAGFGGFGGGQNSLTGEDGRFRFDRLSPGRYTLSATLRSQTSAPVEAVVTGDAAQEVTLTLNEGATLRGTVSGLPEDQLVGVSVNASGPDGYFASTRTGADASFELNGVPEGSIRVGATAGDFATSTRVASADVTLGPGQAEAWAEIVFEAGYRVEVRVSRNGQPVPDAFVNAIPESGGRRSASARTDELGTCVLEGLQDGSYTFMANVQNGSPVRESLAIAGDTTVDLEVPPARIAGVVVEAGSGQPLGDVSVRIEEGGGGFRFANVVSSDSTGRFAIEDVEPRPYRLTLQKPAYETETREVNAADEGEMRVEMRRGEGLGLVVRDGIFGTPLRGLMVRVVDASGIAVFSGSVTLDSQGRGEVPSVKPGSYELRVASSGYAPVVRPGVMVPSSELSLVLTPGGTLEIQVGPQTLALAQAQGRLLGADGRPYPTSIFSTDGVVRLGTPVRRLDNVAPGRYTFTVDSGPRQQVDVREGVLAVVTLP